MKIKQIGIEYFGIFTDFTLDLAPGMNFILGENEAGKSTLLAFIRWVLFGFSKGKTWERYTPASGSAQSGYLILELDDGKECLIKRQGRTLKGDVSVLIDGKNTKPDILDDILGPITENVYRNVFAFGLNELQTLSTIEDSEVSSFLYSSGLYPGNLPLSKIESLLEEDSKKIYSSHGAAKRPDINRKVIELTELEEKLEAYKKEPEEYNQCLLEIEKSQKELRDIRNQIEQTEDRRIRLSVTDQGWQLWKDKLAKEEAIRALGVSADFPLESLSELELLTKEVKELSGELVELKNKTMRVDEDLKKCQVDEVFISHEAEIVSLFNDISKFKDQKGKQKEVSLKIDELSKTLAKRIPLELGEDFNREKLKKLQLSGELNEQIRNYQEKLSSFDNLLQKNNDKLKSLKDQKAIYLDEERDLKSELSELKVRDNYPQIKEAYDSYRQIAPSREYFKQRAEDLQMPKPKPAHSNHVAIIIGTILIAVLSTYFLIVNKPLFGGLGLAFATYNLFSYFKAKKQEAKELVQWQEEEEKRMEDLGRIKQEFEQLQKRSSQAAEILGIDIEIDEEAFKALGDTLKAEGEVFSKKQVIQEKIDSNRLKQQSVDRQIEALEKELHTNEIEKVAIDQNYESFLKVNHLPLKEPLSLLEWLSAARELRARIEELENREEEKSLIEGNIRDFETKVNLLASALKRDKPTNSEIAVISWHNLLKENQELLQKRIDLSHSLDDLKVQEKTAKNKLQQSQDRLTNLLDKGFAKTPEEFRSLAIKAEERKQIEREINLIESNLKNLVKDGHDDFYTELRELSDEILQKRQQAIVDDLERLRDKEAELNETLGRLWEKISQLEQGDEAEKLILEKISLVQQINSSARQWAEIVLCKHLINKARLVYEREKQPGVLKKASQYFKEITANRYIQIISPLTEQRFEVISQNQEIKRPEELSRGTVEQLLLCLRLGLIEEFAKEQSPLPIVIDDILVNFDPKRSKSTLEILSQLTKRHQILFFTCQPHLVSLCEENDIRHNLTVIQRGNIVG